MGLNNMLSNDKAQKLLTLSMKQLEEGRKAKQKRMSTILEISDIYNNKTIFAYLP